MTSLLKFLRLAGRDKLLFLQALSALAMVRLALTYSTYKVIERRIARPERLRKSSGVGPGRIAWAIRNMAPIVPGATCLTQALAAQHMMARHGKAASIRIGVAKEDDGAFKAHAWLMYEDQVVIGGASHDLSRYTSIADLAPKSP